MRSNGHLPVTLVRENDRLFLAIGEVSGTSGVPRQNEEGYDAKDDSNDPLTVR
jgi:hypothetical protein